MKKGIVLLGAAAMALNLSSCKNEQEEKAKVTVDHYSTYVDSVSTVASADVKANWEAIAARSEQQLAEAKAALANLKDKSAAEEKITAAETKYNDWKTKVEAEVAAEKAAAMPAAGDRPTMLRNAFFGEGKLGQDMNFNWVNKDNILSVYQNFTKTFYDNEKSYSREDFDKIKQMYEALDARKNTVEKEGLSTGDNLKIAAIKTKFSPVFKWERGTAKAEENADAKK